MFQRFYMWLISAYKNIAQNKHRFSFNFSQNQTERQRKKICLLFYMVYMAFKCEIMRKKRTNLKMRRRRALIEPK